MRTSNSSLRDVLPVVQLPSRVDETVDFVTLEVEPNWLLSHGAHGVAMAMVSETLRLTACERKEVAAPLCRAMRDRDQCIISVGAERTIATIDFRAMPKRQQLGLPRPSAAGGSL